jgi:hypothetical protein
MMVNHFFLQFSYLLESLIEEHVVLDILDGA